MMFNVFIYAQNSLPFTALSQKHLQPNPDHRFIEDFSVGSDVFSRILVVKVFRMQGKSYDKESNFLETTISRNYQIEKWSTKSEFDKTM